MDRYHKITFAILGLMILMNIFYFVRLENKISTQQEQIQMNFGQVLNQSTNSIYREVDSIRESNKWISDVNYDINSDESDHDEVQMELDWSFNEVESDAEISLMYRERESDWIQVEAEHLEGNRYSATLKVTPLKEYEFQIISEGQVSRTSEIQPIPSDLYRPAMLISHEHHSGDDFLIIGFEHEDQRNIPYFDIENITATYQYTDGSNEKKEIVRGELPSVIEDDEGYTVNDPGLYYVVVEPLNDVLEVSLKVEYSGGFVQEGTVYPEDIDFYESFPGKN
ncbi:hypothetical protein ACTWQB_03170 [Piscibacillus sp. B03]|uniref:hypothetical protein n=1 Tax=Piscibacillus sp. B03 TaxID=3457430 RepID=UPI003FCD0FCB